MREIEIPLPDDADCGAVERIIDAAIDEIGLRVTLRGTLKKHPGCIHWHLKSGRAPGTLELTLWPERHRAWFSIQSGRAAPWIDETVQSLGNLLRLHLMDE